MLNKNRNFVKILKEICDEEGIEVKSFNYEWIFELKKGVIKNFIYGYQFGINPSTSAELCSDKSAACEVLETYGIPSVKHALFMAPKYLKYLGEGENWDRINCFFKENGTIVCKQNNGTGGENVYKVTNQIMLEEVTHKILSVSDAMAVSVYEEIEEEYRIVVLNDQVKLVFGKEINVLTGDGESTLRQLVSRFILENTSDSIPSFTNEELSTIIPMGETKRVNWKHNLGQGANPKIVEDEAILSDLSKIALSATRALRINFASVDIIKTVQGFKVLEVNSGVMMDNFSLINERHYELAKSIYREAILLMLNIECI